MAQQTSRKRPEGLITIGEVVARLRHEHPDVTHSSLRFFEREGLISATRTPGGHRLYTPDDVERIRQIKAWQAQRLTLEAIRERLTQLDHLPPLSWLASEFLRLALSGDFVEATRLILMVDDVGLPLARTFGDILRPALLELGRRWAEGSLLVAQEKEVSQFIRDLVAELTLRHRSDQLHGPALVAACVQGEHHELGLYMICGLLRSHGRRVFYLGPDVAPDVVLDAVRLHQPAAVLLSAKLPQSLPSVHDVITTLRASLAPEVMPLIVVGGQAVATNLDLVRSWGAVPIASDHPDQARQIIEDLLIANSGPLHASKNHQEPG